MYAYFIDISQCSLEAHLWCGGIYTMSQKNIPDIFD